MTTLHQCPNQEDALAQESAVERLHSSVGSSSRATVDGPPSQPLSRRKLCGGSNGGSIREMPSDLEMGNAHWLGDAFERLPQQSDSKWTSSSGAITDRPPLQPLSRRESSLQRIQQRGSRWSSGSRAIFDTALSQAFAGHRMLAGPSIVSALEHSLETKNQEICETTITAIFTSTLLGKQQSLVANAAGTGLHCAARSA
jgi:hypothetical protein